MCDISENLIIVCNHWSLVKKGGGLIMVEKNSTELQIIF